MNQLDRAVDEGRTAVKLAPKSLVAYQQLTRALLALDQVDRSQGTHPEGRRRRGSTRRRCAPLAFDLAFVDKDSGAMQEHLRAAATRQDGYLIVTEAARAAAATGDIDASRMLYARAVAAGRAAHIDDFAGSLIAEQALERRPGRRPRSRPRRGLPPQWRSAAARTPRGPRRSRRRSAGQASRASELAKAYQELQPPAPDVVNAQTPMLHAAIALAGKDRGLGAGGVEYRRLVRRRRRTVAALLARPLRGRRRATFRSVAPSSATSLAHPANQSTSFVRSLAHLQLARAARDAR